MYEKKEELIELLKNDVKKQIEKMTFSNVSSIKETIDKSFQYVLLSIDILNASLQNPNDIEEIKEEIKEDIDEPEDQEVDLEILKQLKDTIDSNSKKSDEEGVFYETIDGGYIERKGNDKITVSESVRRKTKLTHGDIVSLLPRYGVSDFGFPYTIHKLDRKAKVPPSNLQKFDKAILERRGDSIEINKNIYGEQLKDDLGNDWTFRVAYSPRFFQEDSLLAELVWIKGKANTTANIRWRYDLGNFSNNEIYTPETLEYINSVKEKATEETITKEEEPHKEETPTNLLSDYTVLLIGINPKKEGTIKKVVRDQGGSIGSIITGRRLIKEDFLNEIDKNNVDFMIIGEDLSKNGLSSAKKLANEKSIPFIQFNGTDKKNLLNNLSSYFEDK